MPIITKIVKHKIKTKTKMQNYTTKKLVEMLLFAESQEQENEIKQELKNRGEL